MIFNLGTNDYAGTESAKEGVDYVVFNGYKLLNIDHEMYAPREGIIELEPLNVPKNAAGAIRHTSDIGWRVISDKATGFLIGLPTGFDEKTKTIKWQRITLKGKETFDLSIPTERARWICTKFSHFYIDSPNFQRQVKCKYKAIDTERDAIVFEQERRVKRKAIDIAESLVGEELEEIAMMIGLEPRAMSPKVLWKEVVNFAENPNKVNGKTGAQRFMEIYDNETRRELSAIKRGLSTGILENTPDKGISYNGLTLGYNEPEAVKYLRDHPATFVSIDTMSRNMVSGTRKSMAPAPAKVKDEKDAQLEILKKELAEKEAALKEATEKAIEANTQLDLQETNPEYATLLAEAKRLGIKGAHLIGKQLQVNDRIPLLEERIKEEKAKVKN